MAKIKRCYQIVARKPEVIEASGEQRDFTFLQECGAPVTVYGKCDRHQDMTHDQIDRQWRRFVRRITA